MDVERARELARALLSTELPQRWAHVQAVARKTEDLADQTGADRDVVVTAAWLHDIGYSSAISDTGFHPLDGARYLRRAGWSEPVCRLVAHHTDAARQARELGHEQDLRSEFDDHPCLERDVLWTADACTGPAGQTFSIDQRINEIAARYGEHHFVTTTMRASEPALIEAAKRVDSLVGKS